MLYPSFPITVVSFRQDVHDQVLTARFCPHGQTNKIGICSTIIRQLVRQQRLIEKTGVSKQQFLSNKNGIGIEF